jgi:hypothetical protein
VFVMCGESSGVMEGKLKLWRGYLAAGVSSLRHLKLAKLDTQQQLQVSAAMRLMLSLPFKVLSCYAALSETFLQGSDTCFPMFAGYI